MPKPEPTWLDDLSSVGELAPSELSREEAAAMAHESVEDVALDLLHRPDSGR
jgi:hypothetical protein